MYQFLQDKLAKDLLEKNRVLQKKILKLAKRLSKYGNYALAFKLIKKSNIKSITTEEIAELKKFLSGHFKNEEVKKIKENSKGSVKEAYEYFDKFICKENKNADSELKFYIELFECLKEIEDCNRTWQSCEKYRDYKSGYHGNKALVNSVRNTHFSSDKEYINLRKNELLNIKSSSSFSWKKTYGFLYKYFLMEKSIGNKADGRKGKNSVYKNYYYLTEKLKLIEGEIKKILEKLEKSGSLDIKSKRAIFYNIACLERYIAEITYNSLSLSSSKDVHRNISILNEVGNKLKIVNDENYLVNIDENSSDKLDENVRYSIDKLDKDMKGTIRYCRNILDKGISNPSNINLSSKKSKNENLGKSLFREIESSFCRFEAVVEDQIEELYREADKYKKNSEKENYDNKMIYIEKSNAFCDLAKSIKERKKEFIEEYFERMDKFNKTNFSNRGSIENLRKELAEQNKAMQKFIKYMESDINKISNKYINTHKSKGLVIGTLDGLYRGFKGIFNYGWYAWQKFCKWSGQLNNRGIDLLDSDSYYNNTKSYKVIEKMATDINSARDCLEKFHADLDAKLVSLRKSIPSSVKIVGTSNLFQPVQQSSAVNGYVSPPVNSMGF